MTKAVFLVLCILLFACEQDIDKQFCECLKISEELNQTNKAFLENVRIDSSEIQKIKSLSKEKTEVCGDYSLLTGEELNKKREDCLK
jgi:hypothetical protein